MKEIFAENRKKKLASLRIMRILLLQRSKQLYVQNALKHKIYNLEESIFEDNKSDFIILQP